MGKRPNLKANKPVRWLPFIIGLLAVNWIVAGILRGPAPTRVTLPYSTFVEQLSANNIASISSRGATIQGDLRKAVTYPLVKTDAASPVTAEKFRTERPTFATDDLLPILRANDVLVGAERLTSQPRFSCNFLPVSAQPCCFSAS